VRFDELRYRDRIYEFEESLELQAQLSGWSRVDLKNNS